MDLDPRVPQSLRTSFVVHFAVDLAFALPLLFAPVFTLKTFGWTEVDPVAARLVGAALVGIGGESFLGRTAPLESFRTMLRLKLLWSGAAILGLAWSLAEGAPAMTWAFLALFAAFSGLWVTWFRRLFGASARAASA